MLGLLFVWMTAIQAQWSTDANVNNLVGGIAGDDVIPQVATTTDGHTYISWFSLEGGNYNVRMQLFDVNGNALWQPGGLLVSSHPSMTWLTDYSLTVDKEHCAIIGFQDIRDGNNNIYAYRISQQGQFVWGPDGLALSDNTAFEPYPVMAVPDDNQTVFAWQSEDSTGQGIIRLQKVAADSTRLWGQWGIEYKSSLAGENFIYPALVPSDNQSVILVFHKQTGSWMNPKQIWAQKFDAAGNPVWASDVPVFNGSGVPIIPRFLVEPDGAGGVVVCWHDTRAGMGIFNVFVQRINSSGNVLFTTDGVAVGPTTNSIQMNPGMAFNPVNQTITTFFNVENTGQSQWGLAGQMFDAGGQALWSAAMNVVIPMGSVEISNIEVRRAYNQALVTYQYYDFVNSSDARIQGMLTDGFGNTVWMPAITTICNVQSGKVHGVTGYYHDQQWILAWEDGRNGNPDVYAQNVLISGQLGPAPSGQDESLPGTDRISLAIAPNPFSDALTIRLSGIEPGKLRVTVTDLPGKQVRELFQGELRQGTLDLQWDGCNGEGARLAPGVYLLQVLSASGRESARVILR